VRALALALLCVLLGVAPAAANETEIPLSPQFTRAAASRAAVTVYRMPPVPPTGGTETLTVDLLGRVWFNEHYEEPNEFDEPKFPGEVVRMDRSGQITAVATRIGGDDFASAPDGSVWFISFHAITRVAQDGTLTRFPMPAEEAGGPTGSYSTIAEWSLVVAPDGNVWFGGHRHPLDAEGREVGSEAIIGRLTPAGELSEFSLPHGGGYPTRLAIGPDGNVWFTAAEAGSVGFVTPAGQVQEFPRPRYALPNFIAAAPDGVWFTESPEGSVLTRITPTGETDQFQIAGKDEKPGVGPLAAGPDGRIWFAAGAGWAGRIDSHGHLTKVELPHQTGIEDLVAGPEGSLWYAAGGEPRCLAENPGCSRGAYAAGIIGRIDPAPLSVVIEGARLARGGRVAKVKLSCLDGAASSLCRGRVRLRNGERLAGKRRYKLGSDDSRGFVVPLGEDARTALGRRGHLGVRCTVTLAGGRAVVRAFRLRLAHAPRGRSGS
jgi:virginiamycin B lyase